MNETKVDINKQIADLVKVMNYKRSNPQITTAQLKEILVKLEEIINRLP